METHKHTHGQTHREVHTKSYTCTGLLTTENTAGEAWLLKDPISQFCKCSKTNPTPDSGFYPWIALGLLGQVAAGHLWDVRWSSPWSSCSHQTPFWARCSVFPDWNIQSCLLPFVCSNPASARSPDKAARIQTAKAVYIQGTDFLYH